MKRRTKRRDADDGDVKAIGYVRVSTDKQADSGAGIEVQRQAIEAECARKGWELLEIVNDEGLSAKDLNRPGLQGAFKRLAENEAQSLVTSKLDRLSRSVADFCQIVDMARYYDWNLVVLDCQVDTSTPVGEMVAGVLVQFAQFERRLIGQRTKDALRIKKAEGVQLGRPPQIGRRTESQILELRKKGLSMRAIADHLNDHHVRTVRGQKWFASTIKVVLDRHSSKLGA